MHHSTRFVFRFLMVKSENVWYTVLRKILSKLRISMNERIDFRKKLCSWFKVTHILKMVIAIKEKGKKNIKIKTESYFDTINMLCRSCWIPYIFYMDGKECIQTWFSKCGTSTISARSVGFSKKSDAHTAFFAMQFTHVRSIHATNEDVMATL